MHMRPRRGAAGGAGEQHGLGGLMRCVAIGAMFSLTMFLGPISGGGSRHLLMTKGSKR